MNTSFPSRDQLSAMTLAQLRALRIEDIEEEKLVQEIIDSRYPDAGVDERVFMKDIIGKEIETPEQEAEVQKEVDKRREEIKSRKSKKSIDKQIEEKEQELKTVLAETKEVGGEKEKPFCEYCDSKGVRHKKDCPILVK